jgi:hypothetical protein
MLEQQIQAPEVTAYQLRRYVLEKIARLPSPASSEEWTTEARRLRHRILNVVVYHGWPREWVEAPPRFEDLGPIPSGKGYRMRQLRYEIVPGFQNFGLSAAAEEVPVGAEVKSAEELAVGLPEENLTILSLARKLAETARPVAAAGETQRELLKETVRFRPIKVERAWIAGNTKRKGLESVSYPLEFNNGLSAAGTWFKAIASPENAPATIVIADGGRKTSSQEVSARVNRGEQVLALDLLFIGEMVGGPRPGVSGFTHLLSTLGERALGIQAAQLLADWAVDAEAFRPPDHPGRGIRTDIANYQVDKALPCPFEKTMILARIPTRLKALSDSEQMRLI